MVYRKDDLSLEKLKIHDRLLTIEEQLKHDFNERIEFRKHMRKLFEKHDQTLYGNGSYGLTTHIKELQTSKDNHNFNIRAIWIASLAFLSKIIYDVVKS
jgi:hypothetical protein